MVLRSSVCDLRFIPSHTLMIEIYNTFFQRLFLKKILTIIRSIITQRTDICLGDPSVGLSYPPIGAGGTLNEVGN